MPNALFFHAEPQSLVLLRRFPRHPLGSEASGARIPRYHGQALRIELCRRPAFANRPIAVAPHLPPDTIVDMGIPDSEIYKALFDLSQSIAGHTDLETLCNSLAGSLRRVVSFEFLALVLHDPVHDQLRLHAVSANRPYKDKEIILPADGEHFGAWVWREQKPLVLSPLEERGPIERREPGSSGRRAFTL